MRVLITAKCPPTGPRLIGGVQSWSLTVADELIRRGHEVHFAGPGNVVHDQFDFGIIANWSDTRKFVDRCAKHVVVCHGIIEAERPPKHGTIFFTSEGVRKHWGGDGPILRQPIDLNFWNCPESGRSKLTRFSYRNGLTFVPNIARKMGLEYVHLKSQPNANRVRSVLSRSTCVLATGRAALEAMACGVPVVLVDHRASYQGPLMDLDVEHAMLNNYSGRGGIEPNEANVYAAINKAIERGSLRSHVEKHHNVKNVVDQLLGELV